MAGHGIIAAGQRSLTVLPYDLHDDEISVAEAAELAGVSQDVIHQWVHRQHLPVSSRTRVGRLRFRGIDVLHAEHATRARARRQLLPV